MQKFQWDDSLSTGVRMIDIQHKELIVAVNDLGEAIEQGHGSTAIKKILVFLKYYAEWHFEHEERCAHQHQCPIAATNQQAHAVFIERFGQLSEQIRQSDVSEEFARKVYDELTKWLVNHILKIDTQIGACVKQAAAAQANQ